VRKGLRYVDSLEANGGTMMITGIRAALSMSRDVERHRIVSFMTDGYIGNERDILGEIEKRIGNARIFSFGIGSSVNRYLLERMAGVGRGVATYVGNDESSERAVDGLYRRVESPAMTDLEVDWGDLNVADVQPARLPDLFVGRPIVLTGRFRGTGSATVRVRGKVGCKPAEVAVAVSLDGREHAALGKVWARRRIMTLHDRMASEPDVAELRGEILRLALHHGLVSDYTAFVAVDSARRTEGDEGTTVPVAVPTPQGTKYSTTVK
jgi:Ca-activated chloride channel family protein